ncbi:14972_t:CDS:2, partial [Entrophospora sp. SA101]
FQKKECEYEETAELLTTKAATTTATATTNINDYELTPTRIPFDDSSEKRWMLKNQVMVKEVLIQMTKKTIEQSNYQKKVSAHTLSIIRLGLSSIIDLSSEFAGGMHKWFGKEWIVLKEKVLSQVNITTKQFDKEIKNDINRIEKFCISYQYWESRDYVLEKLKGHSDKIMHQQIMRIYFFVGETVSRVALARKIDLQIIYRSGNKELSHSEAARSTTPNKVIKDRSKCMRTNKCILDQYLMHDLSKEAVDDSAVLGLQLAGKAFYTTHFIMFIIDSHNSYHCVALHGQIIGIDLVDNGLYFGFEGPAFRFPAKLDDITTLEKTLEALYLFKDNINRKADVLFKLDNDNLNPFHGIFHTENTSTPNHHKASFIKPTCFTPTKPKQTVVEEIKTLQSVNLEFC